MQRSDISQPSIYFNPIAGALEDMSAKMHLHRLVDTTDKV